MGWLRELLEYQIIKCVPLTEQHISERPDKYHSGSIKEAGDKSLFLVVQYNDADKPRKVIEVIAEREIPTYEESYELIEAVPSKMPTIAKI